MCTAQHSTEHTLDHWVHRPRVKKEGNISESRVPLHTASEEGANEHLRMLETLQLEKAGVEGERAQSSTPGAGLLDTPVAIETGMEILDKAGMVTWWLMDASLRTYLSCA